jgi:O-antigen ligase
MYAGIAAAIGGITPAVAHRRLTWVFYTGTVWQALLACYHLASGTSQTNSVHLSTGGARFVALSIAMYLAAALVLALLNLELVEKGGRRWTHLAVAGLATFVIAVAFGRTTFAALAIVLPLLFLALRKMRRTVLTYVPLAVPVLALAIVTILTVAPSVGATLTQRLSLGRVSAGNDTAVITRQRKYKATLEGIGDHPVFGFGFGRPVEYTNPDRSITRIQGDPENTYVYLLAGGGAFALGAMILLIVAFFADAVRRLRQARGVERALVIFAMALAFVIFLNTLSGPVLTQPDAILTVWIAMLLPALVTRGRARDGGSPRLGEID